MEQPPAATSAPSATQRVAPRRPRPPSDYAVLSERIRGAGLLQRRRLPYLVLLVSLGAALTGTGALLVVLGDSWWQLGTAAGLALVLAQFGFLGHEAAHQQVLGTRKGNEWLARCLSCGVVGLSYAWWTHKHNRHHSAPNQVGRDPDIAPGAIAFTREAAADRTGFPGWFADHQGWWFFPLLLLEGLNLHQAGVRVLLQRRELPWRRLELGLVAVRLAGYVVVLLLVLDPVKALAFLAVQLGLFGFLLGAAFAPNHKGMPIVPRDARIDFLRRQVLMSRNIRGGWLVTFLMGGLNYQVEHHLFPSMPRANLRRARPLVQQFCAERGVTYTETTLMASYAIVVRYLDSVGPGNRDPFSCPLVEQYRG